MPDVNIGVRIGAAAFVLGLSLAGPQAAGTAAADTTETGSPSASSDSASVTRGAPGSPSRPARGARPSRTTPGATGAPSDAHVPSTVVDTDFTSTRSRAVADAQAGSGLASSKPDGPESRPPASASVKAAVPDASASGQVPEVVAATRVPVEAARSAAPPVVTAVPPAAAMSPFQAAAANLVPAAALRPRPAATATALVADRPIATAIRQLVDSAANGLGALPASPFTDFLQGGLLLMRRTLFPNDPGGQVAPPAAPTVTVYNNGKNTIYMYNLTPSPDYRIPAGFQPVAIASGDHAPVTLALVNAKPGQAGNRIYFVEAPGFTTIPSSQVDPFNPVNGASSAGCNTDNSGGASAACNAFKNYSFVEYNLYPATTGSGNWYTIDVSYIDEWSLPIQTKFIQPKATTPPTIWNGAVYGKTYGFKNFDTVVSQLAAADRSNLGPYNDLVSSGPTPAGPQPPSTLSRIIGPDKVWTQQSAYKPCDVSTPKCNFGINTTVGSFGVPLSYSDFVLHGDSPQSLVYPWSWSGTQVAALAGSTQNNFDFWRYCQPNNKCDGPASTPYPIALRTAAKLDGFPADKNGVYGFFTFPNDETAGQFTNIPTAVSLDMYVWGSGGVPPADGASGSVIPGGLWRYSSSVAPIGRSLVKTPSAALTGTAATDTFIMNYAFNNPRVAPLVLAGGADHDLVGIDKGSLGATSTSVDVVDRARFLFSFTQSQFVYETSTGNLYYDKYPLLPGYTGVLGKLSASPLDPSSSIFVL